MLEKSGYITLALPYWNIKGNYFSEGKIMKLAKTVIVSGLLFSSVLGSVNVGSITAMAADNAQTSARTLGPANLPKPGDTSKPAPNPTPAPSTDSDNKESIKLIYTYKGKELTTKKIKAEIDINKLISLSAIEDMGNSNYRIKDGQVFKVFKDTKDNTNAVRVEVEKLKTIIVRCFVDQGAPHDREVKVGEDVKSVTLEQLDLNLQNKVVSNNQTIFNIDNDGIVRVNLESTMNVSVIYSSENGADLSLPIKEVTVIASQDRFNNPSEVPVPAGYELVPGQSLKFVKSGQSRFVRLRVKSVSGQVNNKPNRPGNSNISVAKPSVKPGNVALQSVHITFKDQNSSELVGYKQLTGKVLSSAKVEAPENYALVNEKDATVNFDKKGNKQVVLLVKKMFSAPIMNQGVVTTTNGSYKRLYTLEGKMITNRALGTNSQWYTDQYATVNGEKMYRVATNEWVKASDVK